MNNELSNLKQLLRSNATNIGSNFEQRAVKFRSEVQFSMRVFGCAVFMPPTVEGEARRSDACIQFRFRFN